MPGLLHRLIDHQFLRYLVASVGALAVDVGCLMALIRLGVAAGLAAACAYTLGIIAHWILLSRNVFEDNLAAPGRARTQQKVVFFVTTIMGLGLTTAIVSGAAALHMPVMGTKGLAVVISFLLNWFVRKHFVFQSGPQPA